MKIYEYDTLINNKSIFYHMSEKKKIKGQNKQKPDKDSEGENPLLKIDNKDNFKIEASNLLQEPEKLIFKGYVSFDMEKDKDQFEMDKLNDETSIIIVLRYYEYVCVATFKISFIVPLLQSGLSAKDIFDMIKHSLRNKLLINAPTFDVIFEPEFKYISKVKY